MTQLLVIFDHSGSMQGPRYQTCRAECLKLAGPFELWLFGSDVQEKGIVSTMPEFACGSGTSITVMLDTLYRWMNTNYNKQVLIFTDGEDQYDEAKFTTQFNGISHRNHGVTVYDICKTNVEPLKRIFSKQYIKVATSNDEIEKLVQNLQQIMAHDKDLIDGVTKVRSNVDQLIVNYNKLEQACQQLKVMSDRLKTESAGVNANANQAILTRDKAKLMKASTDIKKHIEELADHINQLKKNKRKISDLKNDIGDNDDDMMTTRTKIDGERNSPNPDQSKIGAYTAQLTEFEGKKSQLQKQIDQLEGQSSSAVQEFQTLEQKTKTTQTNVTTTLQTVQ